MDAVPVSRREKDSKVEVKPAVAIKKSVTPEYFVTQ